MQTLPFDSPEEEARAAQLMQPRRESYHVKRIRTADTSGRCPEGRSPEVGKVSYSKTFRSLPAAQREADAWNGKGDFEKHGPTDWIAEVVPGRAPTEREIRERAQREA